MKKIKQKLTNLYKWQWRGYLKLYRASFYSKLINWLYKRYRKGKGYINVGHPRTEMAMELISSLYLSDKVIDGRSLPKELVRDGQIFIGVYHNSKGTYLIDCYADIQIKEK